MKMTKFMKSYDAIAIVGPTAVGKTRIASEIARMIGGEIISADSRQVYKFLDIGTNKEGIYDEHLKVRLINGIPQYLTDIIFPDEIFTAGDFVNKAAKLIERIKLKGGIPIIVGGTGLYVKSIVDGLAPLPRRDNGLRKKLLSDKNLHEILKEVDPISASKIHPNNVNRIIRALEVYYLTGFPISYWQAEFTKPNFKILQFGIHSPKQVIIQNIKHRVKKMLEDGLIEETKRVLEKGYDKNCPGFQSIGYKHVIRHLESEISYDEMTENIILDTKRYLKRQMTWFRNDKRVMWFNSQDAIDGIVKYLAS